MDDNVIIEYERDGRKGWMTIEDDTVVSCTEDGETMGNVLIAEEDGLWFDVDRVGLAHADSVPREVGEALLGR